MCPPAACPLADNLSRACQIDDSVKVTEVGKYIVAGNDLPAISSMVAGELTRSVEVASVGFGVGVNGPHSTSAIK